MSGDSPDSMYCVMPVFAGHAALFNDRCKATDLLQPNEVKMCCPADALLTPEASAVWESAKSGMYVHVESLGQSRMYVGDRGNIKGGALIMNLPFWP